MLHVRWLGRVRYRDALALQQRLFRASTEDHLLLLEHPHVYTMGVRADPAHVLVAPEHVGAELERADRGGDVTYHGPGQLVGYPILSLPGKGGRATGMTDTVAYVRSVEQLVIDALAALGLPGATREDRYPGVWVEDRKIAAVGVRLSRGRSMHGFALNVDPDLGMFDHIVPCGITDKAVTSLSAEGVRVPMRTVVDTVAALAVARWGAAGHDRADVVWRADPAGRDLSTFSRTRVPGASDRTPARDSVASAPSGSPGSMAPPAAENGVPVRLLVRRTEAGVTGGVDVSARKPPWVKARVSLSDAVLRTRRTVREAGLVTVCEEAGCPNLSECWADGTATFMINGERCTRACGFCLVDTRHPEPPEDSEPERVAEAVERMGLSFAVITTVARDDLDDHGAGQFVATIEAIRRRTPQVRIEVLISDCQGDPDALEAIFSARPDVLNHNLETVARLQRTVRPNASYARSLAVLARAADAGLTVKSGLIVGMGETPDEVVAALADLRAVGVSIVTAGQYLRPTSHHLPVARWWTPEEFEWLAEAGRDLGLVHVEASPLTRSSHHARQAADAAGVSVAPDLPRSS